MNHSKTYEITFTFKQDGEWTNKTMRVVGDNRDSAISLARAYLPEYISNCRVECAIPTLDTVSAMYDRAAA